jgi:hypothetical protein
MAGSGSSTWAMTGVRHAVVPAVLAHHGRAQHARHGVDAEEVRPAGVAAGAEVQAGGTADAVGQIGARTESRRGQAVLLLHQRGGERIEGGIAQAGHRAADQAGRELPAHQQFAVGNALDLVEALAVAGFQSAQPETGIGAAGQLVDVEVEVDLAVAAEGGVGAALAVDALAGAAGAG